MCPGSAAPAAPVPVTAPGPVGHEPDIAADSTQEREAQIRLRSLIGDIHH